MTRNCRGYRSIKDWSEQTLLRTMRMFNILNGLGLMVVGVVIFFVGVATVSFAEVTVAGYIVCVALGCHQPPWLVRGSRPAVWARTASSA